MSDIDALKDEIKKLNARATAKKMDLHDLSEELPTNCQLLHVALNLPQFPVVAKNQEILPLLLLGVAYCFLWFTPW